MLRFVKFACITVGSGAVLGMGGVGWLALHAQSQSVASSNGGSVVLDANTSPTPSPSDGLSVLSPASVDAAGGGASGLLGTTSTAGGASSGSSAGASGADTSSTPAPAASMPGPSDFHQYDSYKDKEGAYFGDSKVGTGTAIKAGSIAQVYYKGWLTDGTLFDESDTTKPGFIFTEGDHHVIAGWEEGLMGMKVGGTRRLIVPPSAGYGAQSQGKIPANSVLIFDVQLLAVQ